MKLATLAVIGILVLGTASAEQHFSLGEEYKLRIPIGNEGPTISSLPIASHISWDWQSLFEEQFRKFDVTTIFGGPIGLLCPDEFSRRPRRFEGISEMQVLTFMCLMDDWIEFVDFDEFHQQFFQELRSQY